MEFPVTPRSENGSGIGSAGGGATATTGGTVRYNECLKNHAASIGGHAIDGCCEFLAAGEEGTLQALTCAACNCHRNFHRKEISGIIASHLHHLSPYCRTAALPPPPGFHDSYGVTSPVSQQRPLAPPPVTPRDDVSIPSSSGGSGMKKRFRTKFTQEQKDKLLAFAEKIGWRIQKEDEGVIQQFCAENSIKKNVLKVWMHNNKKHKKP